MISYTVNLIHTENGYPEVRKRTLKIKEHEDIVELVNSLYSNPITIVSVINNDTYEISHVASTINVNLLKNKLKGEM